MVITMIRSLRPAICHIKLVYIGLTALCQSLTAEKRQ